MTTKKEISLREGLSGHTHRPSLCIPIPFSMAVAAIFNFSFVVSLLAEPLAC